MIFTLVCDGDVFRQILVGQEDHGIGAQALDHLDRVRRGAADVDLGLHLGRGVDVGDDRHAGEFRSRSSRTSSPVIEEASEQPALRSGISTVLSGLRIFEVSAMKCTPHWTMIVGVDLGGLARELERVADEIGDAVVDFRRLVVVRQDDRVALLLERVDRLDVGREERPLDRRDDGLDPLVEMRGLALDLGIPFQRRHRQHAVAAGRVCGRPQRAQPQAYARWTGPKVCRIGMATSGDNMLLLSIIEGRKHPAEPVPAVRESLSSLRANQI